VLLVEDNEVNQRVGSAMLIRLGARVVIAANGRIAVTMTAQQRFDLVFMDCQMPEMDGYAATEAIRARERLTGAARLPIVALTANAMPGTREQCLAAGMNDYVAKPISAQEFAAMLGRWLPGSGSPPIPVRPAAVNDGTGDDDRAFDPRCLRKLEEMETGLALQILTVFRADLAQSLETLTRSNGLAEIARIAHKIKGGSASIGALALRASASDLEQAAQADDVASCPRLLSVLVQAGHAFLAAIRPEIVSNLLHAPPPNRNDPCAP